MLQTSARLLRLLTMLQSRREWAGPDLARRLEIDVRTVRRDVDRLRDLGYVIHASSGPGGGYQLGAGTSMPPLLLEDDEAVAVAVALSTAVGTVDTVEDVAVRVLVKLDQLLPPRLRRRVSALRSMTVSLARGELALDPLALTTIATACRDHEQVRFSYGDAKGERSVRIVEPLRLAHTTRRWYLLAWDCDRNDWRTFRLDRVVDASTTGVRFVPRQPPEDVVTYMNRAISAAPYRHRVRIQIARTASAAAKVIPSWVGVIEPQGATSCTLTTGGDTWESIASHLIFAGVDFELLEPAEAAPRLREVLARIERGLGRPTPA